jgi:hypothetical protein
MAGSGQPPHLLHSPAQATIPANVAVPHHILPRPSYSHPASHTHDPAPSHLPAADAGAPEQPIAPTGRVPVHHFSPPRRRSSLQLPDRLSGSAQAQQPPRFLSRPDGSSSAAGRNPVVSLLALPCVASLPPALQLPPAQSVAQHSEASQDLAAGAGQESSGALAEHVPSRVPQQTASWAPGTGADVAGLCWPAAMMPPATDRGNIGAGDVETGAARQSPPRHLAAWGPPLGSAPVSRGEQSTERVPVSPMLCWKKKCKYSVVVCCVSLLSRTRRAACPVRIHAEQHAA